MVKILLQVLRGILPVKHCRIVGSNFELIKVEPGMLARSGHDKVVGARQVGRVAGWMPGRIEIAALLARAKVGEIASAIGRRSARNRVLGGEEEASLEAGSLGLPTREDHGQLLAFRPVRRGVVIAAQLVIMFLVHERDADVLALQIEPQEPIRTPGGKRVFNDDDETPSRKNNTLP